jgi:hypothetical protein
VSEILGSIVNKGGGQVPNFFIGWQTLAKETMPLCL